jgi:hypothetical protein
MRKHKDNDSHGLAPSVSLDTADDKDQLHLTALTTGILCIYLRKELELLTRDNKLKL